MRLHCRPPQPDPAVRQIKPRSEVEWFAVIAQMDTGKVENVRALCVHLSVSVEQDEIEAINVYQKVFAVIGLVVLMSAAGELGKRTQKPE